MAKVVVIGAGVAGLAAARMLSPFHDVVVVERSPLLGGLAASLSCKAGDACSVCTACTVLDIVDEAISDPRIEVLRGAKLETATRSADGRWELRTSGRAAPLVADAVIVATGLDVADPSALAEYGARRLPGVMTALELDRALRSEGDAAGSGAAAATSAPAPAPASASASASVAVPPAVPAGGAVAFIQCVCSRDVGVLPYCSRVCCAYTARLAMEVKARRPGSSVSVFYMDIQRMDRIAAVQVASAMGTKGIEYIRSRPASVQALLDGRLEVTFEDTATGALGSRAFDRVVLSTGLVPSQGTREAARIMGLAQDGNGFIARGPGGAGTRTSVPGVLVAGGATGPVDIVEAALGGMAAAADALALMPPGWLDPPPRVLVLGSGEAAEVALRTAEALGARASRLGIPGADHGTGDSAGVAEMLEGQPLGFVAVSRDPSGARTRLESDVVVVASSRRPVGSGGVSATPLPPEVLQASPHAGDDGRFVVLMGDGPEALRTADAIKAARPRARVDVLHQDMAVAEPGMQELQMDLACRGVGFHRYAPGTLSITPGGGGGVRTASFTDATSPEVGWVALEADAVLSPEHEAGLPAALMVGAVARLAPEGLPHALRTDLLPVLTPRRGVYTASPGTLTDTAVALGPPAAVMMALADHARGFPVLEEVARVDAELCAACLNCLRICPHDAIAFDEVDRAARVLERACQDCGMCRGVCPAEAISMAKGGAGGVS